MNQLLGSKRPKIASTLVAAVAAIACCASAVMAIDTNAPSWRGSAGSTLQEWTFSNRNNPANPESFSNPFGAPSAAISYMPPYGSGWYNTMPGVYGSAQGWWDIAAGSVVSNIINHPSIDINIAKDMQVQVTYWKDISQAPSVTVTPSATLVSRSLPILIENGPVGGGWYKDVWAFHVDANKNAELINVMGAQMWGSQIEKLTVDTRYVAVIDSAAQARILPEGTVVELSGPVVTRSFVTFFYMENRNRSSGIRINCATGQASAPENTAPKIKGILRFIDGERVIDQATFTPEGSGNVLPLGMNCRTSRIGLIPQALFVKMWGRAHVASAGATTFTLDDGSVEGVPVELHGVPAPADGDYVAVTGVIGANPSGLVLRVGTSDTVTKMN